jgi:hypothetical protein
VKRRSLLQGQIVAGFALEHKLPTMGVGLRLTEARGLFYYDADINAPRVRSLLLRATQVIE